MPRRNSILPPFALAALLAVSMTAVANRAFAGCGRREGVAVYEFEVRSCALPYEEMKAALEAEWAAMSTGDPPAESLQTEEQREAAKVRAQKKQREWENYFEARSKRPFPPRL